MDQFEEIQKNNKRIFIKLFFIIIILALAAVLPFGGYLLLAERAVSEMDIKEAQKAGNWTMPDNGYVLQSAYEMKILSASIKIIEINDKKSGNNFAIYETKLERYPYLGADGKVQKDNLDRHNIKNYAVTKNGEIGGSGKIYYNLAKWDSYDFPSDGKSEGFLGRMDCPENGRSIEITAANISGKYNNARALEFINTFKCEQGEGKKENSPINVNNSNDSDNDGLPDRVENILRTNPENADTDRDGYRDLEEIKNGYSPLVAGADGKLSSDSLNELKEKIRSADEALYKKIFESQGDPSLPNSSFGAISSSSVSPVLLEAAIYKEEVPLNKNWKYSLYVPRGIDIAQPHYLLVGFHGFGGKAKDYIDLWKAEADKKGFIVAVLQAYPKKYPDGNVVESYPWSEVGDFADAVLADVKKNYKIDENNIFLTGHSAGASTAYIVALNGGMKAKGIIAIDGYLPLEAGIVNKLRNARNINFLVIHGANDTEVNAVVEQEKTLLKYGANMEFKTIPDLAHEYPLSEQENIVKWMYGLK